MSKREQTKRFLKTSKLSLRVGASYLKQRVKDLVQTDSEQRAEERLQTHIRNATRAAKTLGEMRGTVMKFGQMLSLNSEFLPDEVREVLSVLQKDNPPIVFSEIRKQVEQELGGNIRDLFAFFDGNVLAAASIGQVHRARLHDGREVVVKVQYPGVDQSVEGDLKNLRFLLASVQKINSDWNFDHIFEEVRLRMQEELNYRNELQNILLFKKLFHNRNDIIIPEPIEDRSTGKVLTLEYIDAPSLREFCESSAPQELRNEVGQTLMRFYFEQLFQHHLLHADPHPGNLAVQEDGSLVVFDFGCLRHFPNDYMRKYKSLISRFLEGETDHLEQGLAELGVKKIRDLEYPDDFFAEYARIFMQPFLSDSFDFGTANLQERAFQLFNRNKRLAMNFTAPAEVVFHDRVLVGTYNNLKSLRAAGAWRPLLEPYLEPDP